ncbi:cation-transporting P-type ATPase [Microbulbifer sp. MLAF003]|uniref:cation-transporting P-type ATPase n=1 Tax=Microbulbifer sp. MLAF003 TaxID=3032582 RepID=UPI0024ACDDF0|nr:cation-transporting P-type ATPase [Microbulbifer sp. MLAF003]WHI51741.1 cation-transporting P-type ATPase [Microbulbifer sp. MLAF003]
MPESGPGIQTANTSSVVASQVDLQKAELGDVYSALKTTPKGLTRSEATARLKQYGPNTIQEKEQSALARFFRFFGAPFPG